MASLDKISPAGFHILTEDELNTIIAYLGGAPVAGGKMKQAGFERWNAPNTGATNSSGLGAVGGGSRSGAGGTFGGLKINGKFWTGNTAATTGIAFTLNNNSAGITIQSTNDKSDGLAVILAMDVPGDYTPGDTMTDIDGNIYPLVDIGGVVVTAENLRVTKYNDGTPIPLITINEDWIEYGENSTGAMCFYDNNPDNGFITTPIFNELFHSKSSLFLFGSVNGKAWNAIAGIEKAAEWFEIMTLSRTSKSYQYFIIAYAGRIENSELKNADVELQTRFNNRLR